MRSDDWMERLAIAEDWRGRDGGPSRLEIRALARVLPAFFDRIHGSTFEVSRLTRFINFSADRFQTYAWETRHGGKIDVKKERAEARQAGLTVLDTQNACHTYSNRDSFFLKDTKGKIIQPLEKDISQDMTYRIRGEEIDRLRERAAKLEE